MQSKNTMLKEKRNHWIKVRVTEKEKLSINRKAKEQDLTISAFILQRTLNYRLRRSIKDKQTVMHLAKIGNNLNQIARWANSYKSRADTLMISATLLSLKKQIKFFAYEGKMETESELESERITNQEG